MRIYRDEDLPDDPRFRDVHLMDGCWYDTDTDEYAGPDGADIVAVIRVEGQEDGVPVHPDMPWTVPDPDDTGEWEVQ